MTGCTLLLVTAPYILVAQSTYGTILGTVKDSSGALVPDASATITDIDENTAHTVKTNAAGEYEQPNLLPGHYSVTISAAGFETFTAKDLQLAARQILRADAALQIGQSAQTVTVEDSENGIIATDTQAIQASFDSKIFCNCPPIHARTETQVLTS